MRHLLILLLFFPATAFSKTIFEPTLALGKAAGNVSLKSGTTTVSGTAGATGAVFGFKYGITRRYIHLTAVIEGHYLSSDDLDESQFTPFGGIGIGYEWNIPLRTYLFAGGYEFDMDNAGGGVELSYLFNNSFWLGLRYNLYERTRVVQLSSDPNSSPIDQTISVSMIMATVSFPFEFNYPDHWFRKTDWQ